MNIKVVLIFTGVFISHLSASDSPIPADQYSINFLWINKNRMSSDEELFFGNGSTAKERQLDFNKRFIVPISIWVEKNPGSFINIFVDSEMSSKKAISYAISTLQNALDGTHHANIQFRDIRDIAVVKDNPEAFEVNIPIYFRVDLLRAIAANHILMKKETKFVVCADLDVNPLSAEEIFDKKTLEYLEEFGFVMAANGCNGFENSFQILNGENDLFLNVHAKIIINNNLTTALCFREYTPEQQVYFAYPFMFNSLLKENGRELENENQYLELMPKKPVLMPPSHFSLPVQINP